VIAGIGGYDVRGMSFAGGAGRTAGPVTVYVANEGGNTVTPIRAASNRAGRPIRVGPGPALIAVSPDGQTAYVVGHGGMLREDAAPVTLTAIRTATNRPGRAYVLATPHSDSQQGFVVPVDIRAGIAGTPIKVGLNPIQIAFTPDGTMAYVANHASQSVTPIRLTDGRAGPAIAAGKIPAGLAVSPDGTTVYVLDTNVFGGMGPGMPFGAQVRMVSRLLFSALAKKPFPFRGQVIPIRVATNSAGKPIKVGRLPTTIAIAP
jgi:DNA-binding beta-propeller fold protein YncE